MWPGGQEQKVPVMKNLADTAGMPTAVRVPRAEASYSIRKILPPALTFLSPLKARDPFQGRHWSQQAGRAISAPRHTGGNQASEVRWLCTRAQGQQAQELPWSLGILGVLSSP